MAEFERYLEGKKYTKNEILQRQSKTEEKKKKTEKKEREKKRLLSESEWHAKQ